MSKIVENNNNIPKTNPFLEMIERKKIYDDFINNGLCCNTCSKKITKLDIDAVVIPESNYLQEWFGFNIYHKCNQCLEKQKLNEFAKSCGWDGRCIKDYLAKAQSFPDNFCCKWANDNRNICFSTPERQKWFPCPDCYPEYWHCAYEKYTQEEYYPVTTEDLWGIGLIEEYIPRPPVYPSPFDTIPKYKQILPIINQPIHHQSVMLLGLIKCEENDRKVLEIEQGGKIKDQENKIKKLENELAELKQFILKNLNK